MSEHDPVREELKRRIESSKPVPAEDGFPPDFDFRGALLRAYDFFSDMSPEGKAKRAELHERVLGEMPPEAREGLYRQLQLGQQRDD